MKYPIGIQNFEDLRRKGFAYVDKTEYVYQLANRGSYYVLSRPHLFGKSLLLSTISAYFEGKRELFKGLALERLETEWKEYPVLHLDLNFGKYEYLGQLEVIIDNTLTKWEKKYDVARTSDDITMRFVSVIEGAVAKTGMQVVILIDEYDKPMLQTIGNEELQSEYRIQLKSFYGVIKTLDSHIRLAFLTGVSKFGKVSVFSDLNNLMDISMLEQYNGICGITESELHQYFESGVEEFAEMQGKSVEETTEILRKQFDGYHFYPNSEGVYNPFSLLNTLENKILRDYWFETGTPTFLVELLKNSDYDLRNIQGIEVDEDVLNSINSFALDPIPLIYQSGYLTIKDYDPEFRVYKLGFPNKEVEVGFTRFLLPFYTPILADKGSFFIVNFVKDVRAGNPEQFMQRLQTFFAGADYRVAGDKELYFQNAMYVVFRMMGFFTEVERTTSRGRIDITIQTKDYIYIIEIKLDGSAQEALAQINEKGYSTPFALDNRKLYKIGVNFSTTSRGIDEWVIE